MRILHLNDRLSARGGADLYLAGLLAAQASAHELVLAVGREDGTAGAPARVVRVPALAAPGRRAIGDRLDALSSEVAPDVIHVHNVMNPEALAWAAGRGAVMTVHDHRCFCPARGKLTAAGEICTEPMSRSQCAGCFDDRGYFDRILATTRERLDQVRRMRAVTVLSRYMGDELAAVGVPVDRIQVVPPFVHGIDPDAEPDGPPCVLFCGRLVETKGITDAIEAHRRSGVELPLVVAGTGSERETIERTGAAVLGWVPHAAMSSLYARARALLLPSRWQEPFGIVGLEALTMGVPVAAWRSGGVADWHPGDDLLVPWGDVGALADALRRAIDHTPSPPTGFDRGRSISAMEEIYRSLSAGAQT